MLTEKYITQISQWSQRNTTRLIFITDDHFEPDSDSVNPSVRESQYLVSPSPSLLPFGHSAEEVAAL